MAIGFFRRTASILAAALPLAAAASVDYTGTDYEAWSYSDGCVAWRATEGTFHTSTVVDVPADGTIVEENAYALSSEGHPWQVFASNQNAYTAPGKVLVYDEAGKTASSDAQFAPLSFGGMWVKVLQTEGVPYCITDNKNDGTGRAVELGAANTSTYFRFDKSFTFDRNSAVEVKGAATVEVASGATFTINNRANKGAKVDSGNTLVLKGEGELAVVAGLIVGGTLDLSAAAVPTIRGDVTLNVNSTIILPAGTDVSATPFTVCSGTLTASPIVNVKIGDADAVAKTLTIENGAITAIADPVYIYYSDYPTTVPTGVTYTYVGGATAEEAATISGKLTVNGTLKTQGFINIADYYAGTTVATLDVESGTTSLNCGDQAICGCLVVREGATLVNAREADAIVYSSYATTVDVYGTLAMGNTRWTLWDRATINIHGGTITGAGQGTNGALDFMGTSSLNADETSEISASVRFRNALTSVTVAEGKTLTLSGVIRTQYEGGGVTKKGAGNLTFTSAPNNLPAGIVHEDGHLVFSTESDVTLTTTYNTAATVNRSLWYATQSNWKGVVKVVGLSGDLSWITGAGNANSTISLQNVSNAYVMASGSTTYSIPGTLSIDGPVEFNNGSSGSTVNIANLAGSSTLVLGGWAGCSSGRYNLNNVAGDWTGTLVVSNGITRGQGGTFTIGIGNIQSSNTNPGDCALPITNVALANPTGTVAYNLANATLNGSAADLVAGANGIYVARARITYTDSTTEYKYEQVLTTLQSLYMGYTPAKAGAVVTVLDGSDASIGDNLSQIYVYDSEAHTYTLKTMVASIGNGIKYYYATLASAVADAGDTGATVTLVTDVSVDESISIASGKTAIIDLDGKTITGPAGGYALSNAGNVTIIGNGTVTGAGGIVTNLASAVTVISNGTFSASGDLFAAEYGSSLTVYGGTFNKQFDDSYLAKGLELHGDNGSYGVREAMGWIYEANGYNEYTGTWATDITYDPQTGKAYLESGNTYTAETPSAGRMVTVGMTISFDAINEEDDMDATAKAAVRLGAGANDGEFVFQLYTSDAGEAKWVDVAADGVTATTNVDYTFSFVFDMTNWTYTATVNNVALTDGDDAPFAFAGASATDSVQSIELTGSGYLTSITGSYEDFSGFVPDKSYGSVTLTQAQADWLNSQNNYSQLEGVISSMDQAEFTTAYLLNLDVTSESYTGNYDFAVTDIKFGTSGDDETVIVTVELIRYGALDGGINGTLVLKGGNTLQTSGFAPIESVTFSDDDFSDGTTTTCTFVKGEGAAAFYTAVIE